MHGIIFRLIHFFYLYLCVNPVLFFAFVREKFLDLVTEQLGLSASRPLQSVVKAYTINLDVFQKRR